MEFSFLNPWFWLGAVALGAPLWLHLRRPHEHNVLVFPTLRFLEEHPEPRRSPRRLQDWLLFLLRALALLAVVVALSWPYLPEPIKAPVKESRVYILDNTLSHQAGQGFTRDRERIIEEISQAGLDVQVAVVELTTQPRVLVAFGDSRETAQMKLRGLTPSDGRGPYQAAFRQAQALLDNSLGERKAIRFLGDSQANQWPAVNDCLPFLYQVEVGMPAIAVTQRSNLALTEPHAQRLRVGDKAVVSLTAQLHHQGAAESAVITIHTNGQVMTRQTLDLRGHPATMQFQTQIEVDSDAWLTGALEISGNPDDQAGDNRVYFTLPPVREGKVLLLAQSPFLRLALSPDIMRGRWQAEVVDASKLAEAAGQPPQAEVLCLESAFLQSADGRKLCQQYLTGGRGVILFVNRLSPAINGALRELGLEAEAPDRDAARAKDRLQFVSGHHPVFHPFLQAEFGNLLDVVFSRNIRIKVTEAVPLAFLEKGGPVIFHGTRPPQKLYVLGLGADREFSNWPVHPTFIPFLDQLLQAARADEETRTMFEPGETAVLRWPGAQPDSEAVLMEGNREIQKLTSKGESLQVPLPLHAGLYSVRRPATSEPLAQLAVNPSPRESELTYLEKPAALDLWRVGPAADRARAALRAPSMPPQKSSAWRQNHWWWLLVIGLLALTAETLLSTRRMRPAGEPGEAA